MKMMIPNALNTGSGSYTRSSAATYFDSAGVMQSAASGVLRIGYDPETLEFIGAIIEAVATNRLVRSMDFQLTWAASGVSIGADTAVAIDGTPTADKLIESAATAVHRVSQSPSAGVMGGAYCLSVFGKAAQRRYLHLALDDGTSADGIYATFDLVEGTVTQSGKNGAAILTEAGVKKLQNGWVRCWVKGVPDPTITNPRALIGMADNGTPGYDPSYVGDGSSGLYVWGAQCEDGLSAAPNVASPTSFIATASSVNSRNADSFTGSGFVYSNVAEPDASVGEVAWNNALYYTVNQIVTNSTTHRRYASSRGLTKVGAVTTISSPGKVQWVAHGLMTDAPVRFPSTTGALPTGLALNTTYYVKNPTANDFELASTPGGASINFTGSSTGTHTIIEAVNINKDPTANADFWTDIGPSNRYRPLDDSPATYCSATGMLVYALIPRVVNSWYISGMQGSKLTVQCNEGGAAIYNETFNLDAAQPGNPEEYFFVPFVQLPEIGRVNMPYSYDGVWIITLIGSGEVRMGLISMGEDVDLGVAHSGTPFTVDRYDKVTFDQYGQATVATRGSGKNFEVKTWIDQDRNNQVYWACVDAGSKFRVFIGVPDTDHFNAMNGYALLETFSGAPKDGAYVEYNFKMKSPV